MSSVPEIQITRTMNLKIDLKSAACGLCLGILALAVVAAAEAPTSQIGRYQIAGSLNYFLIVDTTTGKVWTGNFPSNGSRPADPDFFSPKN
jgi:hypothetical protein